MLKNHTVSIYTIYFWEYSEILGIFLPQKLFWNSYDKNVCKQKMSHMVNIQKFQ